MLGVQFRETSESLSSFTQFWLLFQSLKNPNLLFIFNVFQAFGGNTTDDILERWIKESDSDGDAKVDFHEFLKFNAMSIKKKKEKEALVDDQM